MCRMGVHNYNRVAMKKVKVRATVNVINIDAGEEAEIEAGPMVWDLLKVGFLVMLKQKNGTNIP